MNAALEKFSIDEMVDEIQARIRKIRQGAQLEWYRPALNVVCENYEFAEEELREERRRSGQAFARGVVMFILRSHTTRSLEEIGGVFRLSYSSALYWIAKIKEVSSSKPAEMAKLAKTEREYLEKMASPRPAALLERARGERGLSSPNLSFSRKKRK